MCPIDRGPPGPAVRGARPATSDRPFAGAERVFGPLYRQYRTAIVIIVFVRFDYVSALLLGLFGEARHPRFALAMAGLAAFLAGSLMIATVVLPQYALLFVGLAPLSLLSLGVAIADGRRRNSSGGGGGGRGPHPGPRRPAPDRWPCAWYETLWTDQLPSEPAAVIRTHTRACF